MDKSQEIKTWDKQQGNRYTRELHPLMLEDNGLTVQTNARFVGEPVTRTDELRPVVYNREYVYAKFRKLFILPLGVKTKKELDALMVQVWAYHKEQEDA